jgi:hypothetical protein
MSSHFLYAFIFCYLSDFLSSSFVAALATANARIASLEAELNASQKAYDVAATAKANAEKLQKVTLGKAKKAEKALSDATKEHVQREQAMTEHLHTMSSAAESECFALSFYFRLLLHWCTCCHLSLLFFLYLCRIYRGIAIGLANGR